MTTFRIEYLVDYIIKHFYFLLKQLSSRFSKNKNENILKLTVNTGEVMFSGEIYYY